jgi:hypothetical protein
MFAVGTVGRSTRSGRKASTLLAASSHNRRAIQAELGARGHIDPGRTALNEVISGPPTPQGVVELAASMMSEAGVNVQKLRKDYTQAIELLFSLPVGASVDEDKFFRRCVEWTGERLGLANVLSADVHRDESTPHCHVLVLPLVDGKMQGSALLGRAATAELRESFYRDVAMRFGLTKPTSKLTGVSRANAARAVLDALESSQDVILRSALWVTVKREIERNPAPFVESLGIELRPTATKPGRTMAQIFTSPGKGPKVERVHMSESAKHASKPIGFERGKQKPIGFENVLGKDRNLSCVGFDNPALAPSQAFASSVQKTTLPNSAGNAPVAGGRLQAAREAQERAIAIHAPNAPVIAFKRPVEAYVAREDVEPLPVGW